jgi:hypothetical protein
LSYNFKNVVITSAKHNVRLPEGDADALKHIGVLTIYKILLIYVYVVLLVWIKKCTR